MHIEFDMIDSLRIVVILFRKNHKEEVIKYYPSVDIKQFEKT